MRLNILLTVFLFCTVVSGLVIPSDSRTSVRDTNLEARTEILNGNVAELSAREPNILGKILVKVGGAVAKKVGPLVSKVAGPIVSKVGGAVSKVASKVAGAASKVASQVASKVGGAVSAVKSKVGGAISAVKSKVGDIASKVGLTKIKPKYTVPGGNGKPPLTFTRKDVKGAVKNANAELQRQKAGMSNRQLKRSPLKDFNNNNHHAPKPGGPANSLPKMKGPGKEYPLRNAAQGPATWNNKGPARVVVQPDRSGKLKFKGVVSHDQSRPPGSVGEHDHFQIKGTRKR